MMWTSKLLRRISVLVYNRFQAWVGNWLVFACKKSTSIYNEDIPYPTFLIKVSPDTGKPFLLSFPGKLALQEAALCRDPGLHNCHLFRQDRDVDNKSDVCHQISHAR